MRIEVKGRNFVVDGDLRERVEKRFEKVARQVKRHRDKRRRRRESARAEPRPAAS